MWWVDSVHPPESFCDEVFWSFDETTFKQYIIVGPMQKETARSQNCRFYRLLKYVKHWLWVALINNFFPLIYTFIKIESLHIFLV